MSADALIPAGKPRRCRHCHRPIPKGPSYGGMGSRCAEDAGLVPHAVRVAKPVRAASDDGPNLLDLIEEGADE